MEIVGIQPIGASPVTPLRFKAVGDQIQEGWRQARFAALVMGCLLTKASSFRACLLSASLRASRMQCFPTISRCNWSGA